jgi:hypothetical protein
MAAAKLKWEKTGPLVKTNRVLPPEKAAAREFLKRLTTNENKVDR